MKKLIIAEKPDVSCKLGALGRKIFGDFILSNGQTLTSEYLSKNEQMVKRMVSKAKKLENDKFVIMFAAGHLLELYQAYDYDIAYKNWGKIPFAYVPKPFKLKIKSGSKELFDILTSVMNSKNIDEIIVATDADKEGQSIFEYIYEKSKCTKKCKRMWTDAFTETGIEKAYLTMKDNKEYIGLKNAGYARMTSDFLMGALLTAKATTKLGGSKEIINVGRVQTAVLSEIVSVENKIKNFKKQKSYQIVGVFENEKGEKYIGTSLEKYEDLSKTKALIKRLTNKAGLIENFSISNVKVWCPPLYDQTSLAIDLASKFNISPDETLAACQSLYQKGIQTYPRTSSRYITEGDSNEFEKTLKALEILNPLAKKYPFKKGNKRIVDDTKVESHSAIVPTGNIPDLSSLSKNDKNVYTEIVNRTIAINYPPAIDEKQSIETSIEEIMFKSNGKKEKERGFREVYDIKSENNILPTVKKGDKVKVVKLEAKEVESQPPKRYTNATILKFMETCGKNVENDDARELMKNKGIGTAATRAEIIKKLNATSYIEVKGKTIYPTSKGLKMIEIFPVENLKNPEFTGNLEFELYKVEKGEKSLEDYMLFIENIYKNSCEKIENSKKVVAKNDEGSLGTCPICKEGFILHRKGTNNNKKFNFYGCNNWKNGCKFTIGEVCGKLLTEKQVKTLLENGRVGKVSGLVTKAGKELPSVAFVIKNGKIELDFN